MREPDFVLYQVGGCHWAQEREEKHKPGLTYTAFEISLSCLGGEMTSEQLPVVGNWRDASDVDEIT